MNSPMWTNATGSFSAKYTTAQNGHVYSIDNSGNIYTLNPSTFAWSSVNKPSNNAIVAISVGSDGSYGVIDSSGDSFFFSYGTWTNLYIPALGIAVGDSQNYIVADYYGTVVESSYGSANYAYGPTKLSTTSGLGKIWGVDGSGTVYQKAGSSYSSLFGKSLKQVDVSVSPSSGAIQICGVDGSGDAWTLSGSTWSQITKPFSLGSWDKFVSVEVGTGKIWAT